MDKIAVTIIMAIFVGFILLKLNIPGGMMVGSIIGASILNIITNCAYVPPISKTLAQILSGMFIGLSLNKNDIKRYKYMVKPAIILIVGMLIANFITGFLIYKTSDFDIITSFMSSTPGGMSNIPIISADMGADSAKVSIIQFSRLLFGVGVFPMIIEKINSSINPSCIKSRNNKTSREIVKTENSFFDILITFTIAFLFGNIGRKTGVPSATLVFAMISTAVFKITTNRAYMPRSVKRFAQVLSGAYIGSSIDAKDISGMKDLAIPICIVIIVYLFACIFIGLLIYKSSSLSIGEALLSAVPAGASDMALISDEIGVSSVNVTVLQVLRMIVVVTFFPQIIMFISSYIK